MDGRGKTSAYRTSARGLKKKRRAIDCLPFLVVGSMLPCLAEVRRFHPALVGLGGRCRRRCSGQCTSAASLAVLSCCPSCSGRHRMPATAEADIAVRCAYSNRVGSIGCRNRTCHTDTPCGLGLSRPRLPESGRGRLGVFSPLAVVGLQLWLDGIGDFVPLDAKRYNRRDELCDGCW